MGNINEEKNIRTHDMSRLINQHLSYEKINTDASASNLAEFLIHQILSGKKRMLIIN